MAYGAVLHITGSMVLERVVRFSICLVLLQLGAAAAPALGALLTFVEAQVDGLNGVQDLAQPSAVVVSPGGQHVYATSAADAAVAGFARNATSGRLTFLGSQSNGQGGVQGLGGAAALVLTPDGMHLYAAGGNEAAVAVFARDAATGQLTFIQTQTNGVNNVVGLAGASSLAVSPDGKNLYVTGRSDNALVVFRRDTDTGELTFREALVNGVGGVDWLKSAIAVVVSPDGADVYVAGRDLGTLAMLRRDTVTGAVTFTGRLAQGVDGTSGLSRPNALAVSAGGTHVYVASFDQDITVFDRDATTGLLTFVQNVNVLPGGPKALTVSPDGARLYVTSFIDATRSELNVFTRAADGTVAFTETYADGENAQGVNGASAVAVSHDDRYVYVAGRADNALAVFANTGSLPPTPTPSTTATFTHPTPTFSVTPTQTTVASPPPTPTPSTSPPPTATPSTSPPTTPTATASPTQTSVACTGDCGHDGEVTVNELLIMVNIALGSSDVGACPPGDADGNGEITIDEILQAVNNTLVGC